MSATLTWYNSGLGTKTGTTNAALIDDLVALFNSKSGDANFKWQVASSNSATSPLYIVLKRKSGAAGRILLVVWSSAPAGNNSAILDGAPSTNQIFGAYFPSGNVDTPSNLTASSGTILGNDSGAVKVWAGIGVTSAYAASFQPFYFDSDEALLFGFQNPAAVQCYFAGAGDLVVDGADNAYPAVFSMGTGTANNFGATGTAPFTWTSGFPLAGGTTPCVRTNYGSANRAYFCAWTPGGAWASQAVGSSDILTNTAASAIGFVPMQLLGQTKLEGMALTLRQIAYGPGTTGPFTPYNLTGPTVNARQFNAATTGGAGFPWALNFKI